jgi:hypothetical protein
LALTVCVFACGTTTVRIHDSLSSTGHHNDRRPAILVDLSMTAVPATKS